MPRNKKEAGSQESRVGSRPPARERKSARGAEGKRGKGREIHPVSPLPLSPSAPARRQTSVAVVGAGRLGTALARALAAGGYAVEALVTRRAAGARRAASRAGLRAAALSFDQLAQLPPADILFITTPDDAIVATAERLAALPWAPGARGRVALHTSGALSSEALAPLRARGFAVGSMHPLAAVTEAAAGAEDLRRAFYCVEGGARAVRVARRVVRDLGGRSFSIDTRDKALYHAAAVMTAGHTVALFDAAARLLAACGLNEARAREVLLPLLASTLGNLSRQTTARALTGTFARADVETVRKHLAALRGAGDAGALAAYALLGRLSLPLAAKNGADAAALAEIKRALAEEVKAVNRES